MKETKNGQVQSGAYHGNPSAELPVPQPGDRQCVCVKLQSGSSQLREGPDAALSS